MNKEKLEAFRAESRRATERAKAVLKPGDFITVARCPRQTKVRVKFLGWNGDRIRAATWDDYHASTITKVNGVPTSFLDRAEGIQAARPSEGPARSEPAGDSARAE